MAIHDKVCLITGANSGIGYESAIQLAKHNCILILLCRSEEKAKATRRKIIDATGNKKIFGVYADLSSKNEIENVVAEIKHITDKLDVLVHNAACVSSKRQLVNEKIELQFFVNYLAPFLLTHHLLPLLKKSDSGRIISVNSRAHGRGKIYFNDLFFQRGYTLSKAYNQSKLATMMFTHTIAYKLKNTSVTANAYHPGLVNTNIGNKHVSLIAALAWELIKILGKSPEKAAEDCIYLALSNEVSNTTGGYFHNKKKIKAAKASYNKSDADKLWKLSLNLCTIDPELYGEVS